MRKVLGALALIGVVLSSWILMERDPTLIPEQEKDSAPVSQQSESLSPSINKTPEAPAVPPESPGPKQTIQALNSEPLEPILVRDLEKMQSLLSKPLLSPSEEREKKALLKDKVFLERNALALKNIRAMSDSDYMKWENAALDTLVGALREGDRAVASKIILEVIQDPQVEDAQLPMEIRKTLGGIKAELLFHATSLAPENFPEIESVLPGPISQKIWQNVQEQQKDNLAESQLEIAQRENQIAD